MKNLWLVFQLKAYYYYIENIHYNDVIMTTIASQIISLTVVYSTIYSDADQRKHQSSVCVTGFCVGNSPGPVNSPHKWPVTRKMFPFDDFIMLLYCTISISLVMFEIKYLFLRILPNFLLLSGMTWKPTVVKMATFQEIDDLDLCLWGLWARHLTTKSHDVLKLWYWVLNSPISLRFSPCSEQPEQHELAHTL